MTIHPRFMIVQMMQFINRKVQIHNHNVLVLDDDELCLHNLVDSKKKNPSNNFFLSPETK